MRKEIKIHTKDRIKQINDFSGLLRMRGIYPTDIDALIDYGGKSFIYIEGKVISTEFKKGQKMALENLVNSHDKAGHKSTAIVFRHDTPATEPVMVASCIVETVYFGGAWHEQKKTITVLQFIEKWEKRVL